MERLSPLDLDAVLAFLHDIYAVDTMADFPARAMRALARVVGADVVSYNEIQLKRQDVVVVEEPIGSISPAAKRTFARLAPQHPLIDHYARTQDPTPRKISDFLSRAQFHELELYQDFFRDFPLEYQMAVTIPSPDPVIGIALNRHERDFSERDRSVLGVIRPHMALAYRNVQARARLQEGILALGRMAEQSHHAGLLVDAERRIRLATPQAQRWIALYLSESVSEGSRLPPLLDNWLRSQSSALAGNAIEGNPEPLIFRRAGCRLSVRFVPHGDSGSLDGLLLDEARDARVVAKSTLSRRETEVLTLVATGQSNPEIADQLLISRRTVQKHLEHIYDKLGVRRRTAAALVMAVANLGGVD